MEDAGTYRIVMEGDWQLVDLYTLPHAFLHNYSFIYCFDSDLDPRDDERIDDALRGYPWRGGYSYVNIYTVLRHQVPHHQRPRISTIRYESPGWIDLILNVDVALQVAKSLSIYLGSVSAAAVTYKKLNKIFYDINKQRRESRNRDIQLSTQEVRKLRKLSDELAKSLGFTGLEDLNRRTGDREVAARLLTAHYRRMKNMAELVREGKAQFPEAPDE